MCQLQAACRVQPGIAITRVAPRPRKICMPYRALMYISFRCEICSSKHSLCIGSQLYGHVHLDSDVIIVEVVVFGLQHRPHMIVASKVQHHLLRPGSCGVWRLVLDVKTQASCKAEQLDTQVRDSIDAAAAAEAQPVKFSRPGTAAAPKPLL